MAVFIPSIGSKVPVQLPDELVSATVVGTEGEDVLFVKLDLSTPFMKHHGFHRDDVVRGVRANHALAGNRWVAEAKVDWPMETA